jgi:hypothetical protein
MCYDVTLFNKTKVAELMLVKLILQNIKCHSGEISAKFPKELGFFLSAVLPIILKIFTLHVTVTYSINVKLDERARKQ